MMCGDCGGEHVDGDCPIHYRRKRKMSTCPGCGAEEGTEHHPSCTYVIDVKRFMPTPKKKMVRVVLSSTSYVDFEAPEGFDLLRFVTDIRATGHWLNASLYVPASEIKGIFLWYGDTPPPAEGNIIPFKPGA